MNTLDLLVEMIAISIMCMILCAWYALKLSKPIRRGLRKKLRRLVTWLKAVSMATKSYARTQAFLSAIQIIAHGARITIPLAFGLAGRAVAKEVSFRRMRICKKCSLYNNSLETCGTQGNIAVVKRKQVQLGCLCYMPIASKVPEKVCWAYENVPELGMGWPAELNDYGE